MAQNTALQSIGAPGKEAVIAEVRTKVRTLCAAFPIYHALGATG